MRITIPGMKKENVIKQIQRIPNPEDQNQELLEVEYQDGHCDLYLSNHHNLNMLLNREESQAMVLLDQFPQFLPGDILNPAISIGMLFVATPLIEQLIKYSAIYDLSTKCFFTAAFCSTLAPAMMNIPRYHEKYTVKKYKLYFATKEDNEDLTSLSPTIDEVEDCKIKRKKLVCKRKA